MQQYSSENLGIKWVQRIKILGVTFTTNNDSITQANIEPKIVQIKREITQWRRRNLTPLGKITVIKSLLMSKLVHLLTALPNPSQKDLKQLERLFFSFLWGGKRDPIKRAKVVQKLSAGGLSMVDLEAFVRSLKLSWLKRMVTSDAAWATLATNELPNIANIMQYGSIKIKKIRDEMNNPFWQDVMEAFGRFSQDCNPGIPQILTEGLWFNDYAKFKCTVVKEWNMKGIRFLGDLVDECTGRVMTREALKVKFGISMTVLCYTSLLRSLPDCIKLQASSKVPQPIMPFRMNLVMNHPNFTRFAYDTLVESKQTELTRSNECQRKKWIRDIGCFVDDSIIEVCKTTHSTRIIIFHYKLVNRIIATNTFLKLINIKDNDKCTFCKHEAETLTHMFWFCDAVQFFIIQVAADLRTKYQFNLPINTQNWFFLTGLNKIEALVITLAKLVIYEARLDEKIQNATHLTNKLKREAEIEYTAARIANKIYLYETRWGPLKRIFL